jgi:hypothetical protein
MRDGYKVDGVTPYIVGFENRGDGEGVTFNVILNNGDRST